MAPDLGIPASTVVEQLKTSNAVSGMLVVVIFSDNFRIS